MYKAQYSKFTKDGYRFKISKSYCSDLTATKLRTHNITGYYTEVQRL